VDVINIAADRQKFMTLHRRSWQRLWRSAVPGIWLCPPKFKCSRDLTTPLAPFGDALPPTG